MADDPERVLQRHGFLIRDADADEVVVDWSHRYPARTAADRVAPRRRGPIRRRGYSPYVAPPVGVGFGHIQQQRSLMSVDGI